MRGWLAVRLAGLDVEEIVVPLEGNGSTAALKPLSPSGLVPLLEHDGNRIWDSLAIGEYCAEISPALWPAERPDRARARAVAAEMHGGFRALRAALPMNLGRDARPPSAGIQPDAASDIARIDAIFSDRRGRFLFGDAFGLADAMYAPVVTRLLSYDAVPPGSAAYCDHVRAHPLVASWYAQAADEPAAWRLPAYERI
jgi:glutathione S-transferase